MQKLLQKLPEENPPKYKQFCQKIGDGGGGSRISSKYCGLYMSMVHVQGNYGPVPTITG